MQYKGISNPPGWQIAEVTGFIKKHKLPLACLATGVVVHKVTKQRTLQFAFSIEEMLVTATSQNNLVRDFINAKDLVNDVLAFGLETGQLVKESK